MTAPIATAAPLAALAATLNAEVRDDNGSDGRYLAFPNDDVILCRGNGKVTFVRYIDGRKFPLGTFSDGPDHIAARFRAAEVSA